MSKNKVTPIDPLDKLINHWNDVFKEISGIPLSPNQAQKYYHKFEADFIKFGWNDAYYSKYSESEQDRKKNELSTFLKIAIDRSVNLHTIQENQLEVDKLKNKKGILDNLKIAIIGIFK
jgi:hypothetical protein